MHTIIDTHTLPFEAGKRYIDYLKEIPGIDPYDVVALQQGGENLSPLAEALPDVPVHALTYHDEEGRRIYERSALMLFLLAVREELGAAQKTRMENSLGKGIYITLDGITVSTELAQRIENRMHTLSQADLPLEKNPGTRRDALDTFSALGQTDKVRLLKYRNFEHFLLYNCSGLLEYFYGEMVPSTGYIRVFRVMPEAPGLLVMMPDNEDPSVAGAYRSMPKLKSTFAEMAAWNVTQGISNAADLNDRIAEGGFDELIRICEGKHEHEVYRIAEAFIASGARLLLIAGPSSSGKTTFSHRLKTALTVLGKKPLRLSLDEYYLDRDKMEREPDGSLDFEKLEALNVPLLCDQLAAMIRGETVDTPHFNFKTGCSEPGRTVHVGEGQPIIIEGIHGLNEKLTATIPRSQKFKVYISALTTLNLDDHNRIRTTDMRLLRRIVRDNLYRGTKPEETIAMWPSVRRGEELYIFPYQEEADIMFNSSLGYELCIMKKFAYPLLKAVEKSDPAYSTARRMVKFLNYIYSAEVTGEIPPGSLLREFVGGSCYADIKE